MTTAAHYELPDGQVGLTGPVSRPALGTVALRGDLAHIALAGRYLAAHYVVPQVRAVGDTDVQLRCHPRDDSDPVVALEAGSTIEALDYAGDWCWACCGPEGPSGYLRTALLAQ